MRLNNQIFPPENKHIRSLETGILRRYLEEDEEMRIELIYRCYTSQESKLQQEALSLCQIQVKQGENDELKGYANIVLGVEAQKNSNFTEAEKYFQEALKNYKDNKIKYDPIIINDIKDKLLAIRIKLIESSLLGSIEKFEDVLNKLQQLKTIKDETISYNNKDYFIDEEISKIESRLAQYVLSTKKFDQKKIDELLSLVKKYEKNPNIACNICEKLAEIYASGYGDIKTDLEKALYFAKKIQAYGSMSPYAKRLYHIANIYKDGYLVKKDLPKAAMLYVEVLRHDPSMISSFLDDKAFNILDRNDQNTWALPLAMYALCGRIDSVVNRLKQNGSALTDFYQGFLGDKILTYARTGEELDFIIKKSIKLNISDIADMVLFGIKYNLIDQSQYALFLTEFMLQMKGASEYFLDRINFMLFLQNLKYHQNASLEKIQLISNKFPLYNYNDLVLSKIEEIYESRKNLEIDFLNKMLEVLGRFGKATQAKLIKLAITKCSDREEKKQLFLLFINLILSATLCNEIDDIISEMKAVNMDFVKGGNETVPLSMFEVSKINEFDKLFIVIHNLYSDLCKLAENDKDAEKIADQLRNVIKNIPEFKNSDNFKMDEIFLKGINEVNGVIERILEIKTLSKNTGAFKNLEAILVNVLILQKLALNELANSQIISSKNATVNNIVDDVISGAIAEIEKRKKSSQIFFIGEQYKNGSDGKDVDANVKNKDKLISKYSEEEEKEISALTQKAHLVFGEKAKGVPKIKWQHFDNRSQKDNGSQGKTEQSILPDEKRGMPINK